MRFFLFFFIFISLSSFADNTIVHRVSDGGRELIIKIYSNESYIKIDNGVFTMIIDKQEQNIRLISIVGSSVWHGDVSTFNTEYIQLAEFIAHKADGNINKAEVDKILSKIDAGDIIIKGDKFENSQSYTANKTQKTNRIHKKAILDYKCNTTILSYSNSISAELMSSNKLAHNSVVDIQMALRIFNKISFILNDAPLLGFDYAFDNSIYEYPMQLDIQGGASLHKEMVVAADDSELSSTIFDSEKENQDISLEQFIQLYNDLKSRR